MRIRVETDGASRGNPGEAAGAAVLFDEAGHQIARVGRYLGQTTNNVAEYTGLVAGLELAAKIGATEVEVRADSELMVRQLNGLYRVKNPGLMTLYLQVTKQLKSFQRYHVVHVPRERNRAADKAANEAVDRRESYVEIQGAAMEDGAVGPAPQG